MHGLALEHRLQRRRRVFGGGQVGPDLRGRKLAALPLLGREEGVGIGEDGGGNRKGWRFLGHGGSPADGRCRYRSLSRSCPLSCCCWSCKNALGLSRMAAVIDG